VRDSVLYKCDFCEKECSFVRMGGAEYFVRLVRIEHLLDPAADTVPENEVFRLEKAFREERLERVRADNLNGRLRIDLLDPAHNRKHVFDNLCGILELLKQLRLQSFIFTVTIILLLFVLLVAMQLLIHLPYFGCFDPLE
jgi:hypothetical protein